jgi:hypothetical protein
MAAFLTAPVKWAQRKDSLYVTISLPDVKDEKIDVSSTNLTFTGSSDGSNYQVDFEFFKEIDLEGSVWNVLPQSIQMHLMKKDKEEDEFWPRLLKDKLKEKNGIKIDWDKYVDEDEEEEGFDTSALDGGQGMGGMGGMPGMGGMGGMGGPGGMDMAKMQEMLAGMGGGAGGMDMEKMMAGMGGGMQDEGEDSDDGDDDDMPDLEPTA